MSECGVMQMAESLGMSVSSDGITDMLARASEITPLTSSSISLQSFQAIVSHYLL